MRSLDYARDLRERLFSRLLHRAKLFHRIFLNAARVNCAVYMPAFLSDRSMEDRTILIANGLEYVKRCCFVRRNLAEHVEG